MPQQIDNTIFVQQAQPKSTLIKDLAYKTGWSATSPYRTYRLERSTPVFRRGAIVVVVPRFKGLTLYTPTAVNGASHAFQTTLTGVAVAWPSKAK